MSSQRILVIGHSDVGRRVCGLLQGQGIEITHLDDPADAELRECLDTGVDGVAVMLHDDIRALRYSLMIEHLRPGIRLFVAMFDRTTRAQIERAVPNVTVLSPAAIAVPSMVAAAIAPQFKAVRRRGSASVREWVAFESGDESYRVSPFRLLRSARVRGWFGVLRGQGRPYDRGTAVLMYAAIGLGLVTLADALFALGHEPFITALKNAVLTTATITTPAIEHDPLRELWAALAAFLVMLLAAAFGAGLVHHLLEGGHVSLFGRRVAPRSGHVIVAGLGQVGLRLAQELKDIGVPVVAIEKSSAAPTLGIAKSLRIPVVIGSAASQSALRRAGARRALAVVAAGSDERENISIAVDARAAAPSTNLVLRAGSDPAIDETRSLFHIAIAIDINALTAAFVAHTMAQETPYAVVHRGSGIAALDEAGEVVERYRIAAHCSCV